MFFYLLIIDIHLQVLLTDKNNGHITHAVLHHFMFTKDVKRIVQCYGTVDAVLIGNSFITVSTTRNYSHSTIICYAFALLHNYNHNTPIFHSYRLHIFTLQITLQFTRCISFTYELSVMVSYRELTRRPPS
jgi:hypothetical protein